MGKGKPYMPLTEPYNAAGVGVNPKTGQLYKYDSEETICALKEDVRKFMRVLDEQDAVSRYTWGGIPMNLSSEEIERLLYYKYQLAFFYFKEQEEFYLMPYALDGTIDFYGRFNYIHPVPMANGVDDEKSDRYKNQLAILSQMRFKVIYGVLTEEPTEEELTGYAVILRDYQNQLGQSGIPRQQLDEPLINIESELIPFMRTNLLNSTGIIGMRVQDQDQQQDVKLAAKSVTKAALKGEPWIPVVGDLEFQELTGGQVAKSEEYMLALQSIDNLRLRGLGIENGGLFEKKAHELQTEANMATGAASSAYQDGLNQRQHFCNIVNSIWGIGIYCQPSETVLGDMNGDFAQYDDDSYEQDSSGMEDNYNE